MSAVAHTARIVRHAALVGWRDEQVIYTWRTWVGGWLLRVIAQVIFFALIGLLLGSRSAVHFILVGNAVMLASMSATVTVATTTWERFAGTLPLLVAAPSSHVTVFVGRSLRNIAEGLVIASAGLLVAAPLFDLTLPWPRVAFVFPLIALVATTTYLFACFLGGIVLWAMDARNVVLNVSYLIMMAICGVNVPVSALPDWAQLVARLLPLTHGLEAVRLVLDGAAASAILPKIGIEVAIGIGWLAIAVPVFWWLAEQGRRDGSIEFGA